MTQMPSFDWSRYNAENNNANFENHDREMHDRAHSSQYEPIFQMAMARFEENFEEFTKHYDDKDPHAHENFMHLYESAVVHALNNLLAQSHKEGKDFDEVAAAFAMAGFGFILGRTFQEFEIKHLMQNNDLRVVGQTITTVNGSSEV
jgi:hypothetical protein